MATANTYGGRCTECGKWVKPFEGWATPVNGKYVVSHRNGCPETPQKEPNR